MSTPTDLDFVLHFLMSLTCIKQDDFKGVRSRIMVTERTSIFPEHLSAKTSTYFCADARRPFRCGEDFGPFAVIRRLPLHQVHLHHAVPSEGIKFCRETTYHQGWTVGGVGVGWFREPFGFAEDVFYMFISLLTSTAKTAALRRNSALRRHDVWTSGELGGTAHDRGGRRSADHPKPAHRGMSALGLQRTPPAHHPFLPRLETSSGLGDLWSARQSARRGVNQRTPLFTPVEPVAAD
ncbi:hypothetical protein ARMSODRAFT_1026196 [Armillaria solidipes]|uniref:Uncharacterized protein n=1 Tax=Armillaria solidipes TaxID=1076256 RepID=A0A2H3B821_9AGAR|nr:hypothetical protein ARMSODRAFT_1026196 [Armillaria solidipes]